MGTQTQLRTSNEARSYNGSGKKQVLKDELRILHPKQYDLIPHSANRMAKGVSKHHIRKLKKSMTEQGFLKSQPIIVDENHRIVDGHHRFSAAKELGISLYYKVIKGADILAMAKATSISKAWQAQDWVAYHASSDNPDFVKLLSLMDEFDLKVTVSVPLSENKLRQSYSNGNLKQRMMDRSLEVDNWGKVWGRAKMLKQVRDKVPHVSKHGGFMNAWVKLNTHPQYDHKRMLNKLEKYIALVREQPSTRYHLEQLVMVYNYRTHKSDKIKFSDLV